MDEIITSIILAFLVVVEVILYCGLSSMAISRIVRIECSFRESLDRGLKKYLYPSGRAVSYEPHPSMRKYIQRYILFTNNGYKFFKCRLGEGVREGCFSLIMFNNKDRVVDILDVEVSNHSQNETPMLQIHKDTSYVSVVVDSVNGKAIEHPCLLECKLWKLLACVASATALNFLQLLFVRRVIEAYDEWFFESGITSALPTGKLLFVALLIGAITGVIVFFKVRAKKVRWSI